MKKKLLLLLLSFLFSLNHYSQSSIISQVKDCTTGCSDLTIDFDGPSPTLNYNVASIPNNPPASYSGLENQLFSNIDDIWSDEVILPFTFSFYGETYDSLIIGANGVISFNVSNAGGPNGWSFGESLPNNTNTTLSQANIFWAGHDVYPSAGNGDHEIGYEVFGAAPNRMFVASFFNVAQYDCEDLKTTQMVVLYETTNIIEVHILDKPVCQTWNSGNAVLGIQNPAGTEAVVPPGRNTGAWEATNESWRFSPAGNGFENEYAWYNEAGVLITTDTSINVCPTINETYTAEVNYYDPSLGAYQTVTETVILYVTVSGEALEDLKTCNVIETDVDFDLTVQTEVITGGSTCSIVSYYTSIVDAENDTNAIANPEYYSNISNPETIYVRVQDIDSGSYETTMFNLVVNLFPEIYASELLMCPTNVGFATFQLSDMDNDITGGNTDNTVSYYTSYSDAENAVNMLPDVYENETANNQVIYARVEAQTNACYSIAECFLNVNSGVVLENIGDLIQCDAGGVSSFDLFAHIEQHLNGNIQPEEVTFFETQEDAYNETNVISLPDNYTNTSNPQTIFVRAQVLNSECISYGNFVISVEDGTAINTPTPFVSCDYDGVEDGLYLFNLTEKNTEILEGLDPNAYAISYYETEADAMIATNALNATAYYNTVPNLQTVYARVENLLAGCIVITTLELIIDTECAIACQQSDTFCYEANNTTEYTYTSENGAPLTIVFTAGKVENDWDELLILDSDGVTNLNEANPYGNNGDLTGLTFTSSGDTITVFVQSDASVSCANSSFLTPISFYLYCEDAVGVIHVNAFYDENSNTVFDASETNFNAGVFTYEVNNDGIINYVNSSNGNFAIPNTEAGNSYDISFVMYDGYQDCLNQTFTLVEDVVPVEGEISEVNFPLTQLSDCNDIAVHIISYVPPRPGQTLINYLVVENLGSLPVSGSIEFTHDDLVTLNTVSGVDTGNTITNTPTGFILNFNNLTPGYEEQVSVQLNVSTSLNIGDYITNSVVYNETDININNNASSLTEAIVNSYDPNNKIESHGPEIKLDDFTDQDYLYYTINFQNLGTAEALEVRVEDVLDSQLDASTFKMLNASHDYVVTRTDNNLIWNFDAINLPSESMDEPNSHGYVYFKVKPLAGYQDGDIIPNTADIYFDFNPAITTNTFETEFVTTLSVNDFSTVLYSMYPNPANNTVHVQFDKAVAENLVVNIYNVQGKLVSKINSISNNNKISFNVSNLSQGMYFVELKGESFIIKEKLIIK
ncbi:T9SS type A sorting domain-containing protein [Bizionia arctica]|uniref:T9SS type A sorting domain-containing protein n=1 Tax=Bizionia arctica TaxID=1495645 RepID=A0A917LTY7_9FLAO|nr:T9SS type A sorting domain-containing protein [Bizionia arctica]GGG57693.1 hypothetical protein GCM10010976_30670 [Bizionia arctica]